MTKDSRVIKIYESFRLGICNCGCNKEIISIRAKRGYLCIYKKCHHNQLGDKNPYWKGGRRKQGGYWMLYMPDYFSAQSNGYVPEHVYFYQEYHKCCMLPWGYIHHIDPVREGWCNNMPWNLQGMTNRQHTILHMTGNQHNKKDTSDRRCSECGSDNKHPGKYENWYGNEIDGWKCRKCYNKWYNKNKR